MNPAQRPRVAATRPQRPHVVLTLVALVTLGVASGCGAATTPNLDNYDERHFDRDGPEKLSEEILYLNRNKQDIFNRLYDILFARTAKESRQKRLLSIWSKLTREARIVLSNMAIKEQVFQTGIDANPHDQFCWNLMVKLAHDEMLPHSLRKRAVDRVYRIDPDGANSELATLRAFHTEAMIAELDLRSSAPKRVQSAIKILWRTTIEKEKPRLVYLMRRRPIQEHLVKHLSQLDAEARQILLSATFQAFPERFPGSLAAIVRAGLKRPDLELKIRAAKAAVFLLRGDGLLPSDFRLVIDDATLPRDLRRRAIALLYQKHPDRAMAIVIRWIDRPVVPPTVGFDVLLRQGKPNKSSIERLATFVVRASTYEEMCTITDLASKRAYRKTIRRIGGDAKRLLEIVRAMRKVEAMMVKFGGNDVSTYIKHLDRSYRHQRYGSQLLKRGLADRGDEELTQAGLYLSKARQLEPKIWTQLSRVRRKFTTLLRKLGKERSRLSRAGLKKRVHEWQSDRFFKSARFITKLQES
ncbi:MAG: hypothetical protein KC609_02815 [Myxococcales bacterium]|nr:hypothetical protein [Myxococcales bacterium]